MNLPAFCIKRPTFTIVMSLILVLIGLLAYFNLSLRWIPNISLPYLTIETTYPGANATILEREVTKVIEGALSGINGIDTMTSITRRDSSEIELTFKLGTNINDAVQDVRTAIEQVRSSLPRDITSPVVLKADPDSNAILYISFTDTRLSAQELSDYINKFIQPIFETLDGVGKVQAYGSRVSQINILLDPLKMAGAGLTVDQVSNILQEQNMSLPSGQIRGNDRFYSILTNTALLNLQQFNDLILKDNQNHVTRIKDIGEAVLSAEDTDSVFRINGQSAIALGIVAQTTANPLEIEQKVKKALQEIKRTLPQSMHADIIFSQADFIRASVHSVYEAFFEAIIFVWCVILIFLGNFRATLIPIITIPVCMLATFFILYFFGFTINTLTLMAFVLAIGLVVDDAIVMLENISRHLESGLQALEAAFIGSKEIIVAIIAMTITLTAVYAPIAFTPGMLGVLFKEFTFTLAGAVLISGFVALTLSPMMCAKLLKTHQKNTSYAAWLQTKMHLLESYYQKILLLILRKRKYFLAGLFIAILLGIALIKFIPQELAPNEDMGQIFVNISAPKSSSYAYTDSYNKKLDDVFLSEPNIKSYLTMMHSPSHAFQLLLLKPKNERQGSLDSIVSQLTLNTQNLPGVRINVFEPPPPLVQFSGSDSGDKLGLSIMTSGGFDELQTVVSQLLQEIRKNPGFIHADNSMKWDDEQFQININREKAADLHVSISNISSTISTLLAGKYVGKTDEMNIKIQLDQNALSDPNIFQKFYVRNNDDKMIPLSGLINVQEVNQPEVYRHVERLRADNIYLTLAPNYKISEAVKALDNIAKNNIPHNMKYTFIGEAKDFLESNSKSLFTFLLAILFIYLVLAAQFESFIDPLIILLSVPFAIIGALLTLKLFGGSLNIYSNIGMITLVGLIAKHGILITEFANKLQKEGKNLKEAILTAALLRLRPILMTTSAMILGALPLVLAMGPGSESRVQVGLVITGGMLFGTFFSLVVIPVAYTIFSPFSRNTDVIH